MTDISDTYEKPPLVRQWDLIAGFAQCILDAIPEHDPGVPLALGRNAVVRAAIADVEAYEAAARVAEPDEAEARTVANSDGALVDNPAWVAYDAARAVVVGAGAATLALARIRAGEPDEGDEALIAAALAAAQPVAAAAVVPEEVELWRARTVLEAHGILASAFALADQTGNSALRAFLEYGNTISRNSPSLAVLAQALQLTEQQVDGLFIEANALQM